MLEAVRQEYDALIADAAAIGQRLSALESSSVRLVEPRDFTLLGGWRIPSVNLSGENGSNYGIGGTAGSWDFRRGNILIHHAVMTGRIAEYAFPQSMGSPSQPVSQWPAMSYVDATERTLADVVLPTFRISPRGVLWDEETESIWVSGRQTYQSSPEAQPANWLLQIQAPGPISQGVFTRHTPNVKYHWTGGGFARIPASLRPQFGGARFAAARGGYDMAESSIGPTFGAVVSPADIRHCIGYPVDVDRTTACKRDAAYLRVPHTEADNIGAGRFYERIGNEGRWQIGEVFDGCFVESPGLRGYILFANQSRGTLDYRSQDARRYNFPGEWGKAFRIPRPDLFYSQATEPWTGHGWAPSTQPQYADGPPGLAFPVAHIYDPEDMAAGFSGQRESWESHPTQRDWLQPPAGYPAGCRFDAATGKLYVLLLNAHGSSMTNPALAVYQCSRNDAGVNPPFRMPDGWSYDAATGDMVRV